MKADQTAVMRLLKTARGQLEATLRMVEENRYCVDISNQLLATIALLRKVNEQVLDAHVRHCVLEAFSPEVEPGLAAERCEEILALMHKLQRG